MARSGIRVREVYPFREGDKVGHLTIAETWQRTPRRGPTLKQTDAVRPFARQIKDFLQHPEGTDIPEYRLVRQMVEQRGYSLAYEVPDHVLAFGFLLDITNRLRIRQQEYAFNQFGVTWKHNLRSEEQEARRPAYLRAAAGLMHAALTGVRPEAHIYITEHPDDTREGFFFNEVGFRRVTDAPSWGTGEGLLVARAGQVVENMIEIPDYAFLKNAGQQTI